MKSVNHSLNQRINLSIEQQHKGSNKNTEIVKVIQETSSSIMYEEKSKKVKKQKSVTDLYH